MTVLFHFALSLSKYEYRRRHPSLPTSNETDNLIRNQAVDESYPSNSVNNNEEDTIVKYSTVAKKNFFKSPLLYQNALLYVFSRLFMTTSLVKIVQYCFKAVFKDSFSPGLHSSMVERKSLYPNSSK